MKYIVTILFFAALAGSASGQKLPAGEPEGKQPMVKFFPNPATTFLNFEFKTPVSRGHSLEIFSFLGRKMMALPVNNSRMTVNITDFFRGVYVFQLRDETGRVVETNKFQVSK
ncbi:MAG TPA: T9SS type A sorting domain-containing protein [Phnomibacter sp.]|nr:T9SS type A sorting domain-containing protein [Phnomibacter sp.]